MKLSVIIPYTFGDDVREKNLSDLTYAIVDQTFTDYELIIVEEVIGDNKERAAFQGVHRYITLRDSRKFNKSWCINVGVKNAQSDNVLVLDADMTFGKDYFERVMDFASTHPKFFNGFDIIRLLPGKDNPKLRVLPFKNQAIIGGAWFTNKKFFFDELGGFSEDYFGYGGEDNDTGERAKYILPGEVIPALPYMITHQYHDWHKPDGAMPLNPIRYTLLNKTKQDPGAVIKLLKAKQLGKEIYPTFIYDINQVSQSGEERIINKYLGQDPKTYKGKYIDMGAGHPINLSNSYYYYCLGWNGILIEPNPECVEAIKQIRPKDILFPNAISDCDGKIKMCKTVTVDSRVGNYYLEKLPNEVYEVDGITLDTILKQHPDFISPDFISMDIESFEDRILSKCNFDVFKPKIIVIEYWERGVDKDGNTIERMDYRSVWEHFLLTHYDFKEIIGGNAVYVRKV